MIRSSAQAPRPSIELTPGVRGTDAGGEKLALRTAPEAGLSRRDSFHELVQRCLGLPLAPGRRQGDTRALAAQGALWVAPGRAEGQAPAPRKAAELALLWGGEQLLLKTEACLGEGTNAQVFLGIAVGTGELLALKRTPTQDALTAHAVRKTAKLMALHGSSLAPQALLETGADLYTVEPLLSLDLHDLDFADERARVRSGIAWLAAQDILPSLIHLHQRGVAHRDIKPCNIMQRRSAMQLIDYNLATRVDSNNYETTANYAPPEAEDPAHPRAGMDKLDRWCLGATLLQIAGGDAAHRLLECRRTDFPSGRWHPAYAAVHAPLLADKPLPKLTAEQRVVCDAFLSVDKGLRPVILELMALDPRRRLDLETCQERLDSLSVRARCDLAGARTLLRRRARESIEELKPTVDQARARLQAHAELITGTLAGALPGWLLPDASPAAAPRDR